MRWVLYLLLFVAKVHKKNRISTPSDSGKNQIQDNFCKKEIAVHFPEYTNSVLHGCIQQSAWLKITNGQNGFTRNGVRVSTRIRNFNRRTGIDCINRSVSSMTAVSTKTVGFESCVYWFSMAFTILSTVSAYEEEKCLVRSGKDIGHLDSNQYVEILGQVSPHTWPFISTYFVKYL